MKRLPSRFGKLGKRHSEDVYEDSDKALAADLVL